jgi:hypothetical protein
MRCRNQAGFGNSLCANCRNQEQIADDTRRLADAAERAESRARAARDAEFDRHVRESEKRVASQQAQIDQFLDSLPPDEGATARAILAARSAVIGREIETQRAAQQRGTERRRAVVILVTLLLLGGIGYGGYRVVEFVGSFFGDRESAVTHTPKSEPVPEPAGAPATSTACARSPRPGFSPPDGWRSYRCRSEDEAGDSWSACLTRSAYSDDPAEGCPGDDRCCPPQ